MAVIAVYSVKGGVGKTTLAVDLAWRWAVQGGHETLLWDLDAQGGVSFLLGLEPSPLSRVASIFQREGRPRDLIVRSPWPRLNLLQSDESLRMLPLALARIGKRRRLAQITRQLESEFPRIVVDCPPMLNEVSDQIMVAADVLIVPLPASPLAARALDLIRSELMRNHSRHPPILPVLSMYDSRRKLHREARETLASGWPIVPMSSLIEQTAVRRAPLATFAAGGEANQRLHRLWEAIEGKLRLRAAS